MASTKLSTAIAECNEELGELRAIPIELLRPGKYQPRKHFPQHYIEELAESIRAKGVLQPLIVRPIQIPGSFEIIAGECRWRGAQLAGKYEVPCVIKNVPDEVALAMALIENLKRKDLNPIETAEALKLLTTKFEMTQSEAAAAIGENNRTTVAHTLRLLTLEDRVQELLRNEEINYGHGRVLVSLSPKDQLSLAEEIASKGMSVRLLEKRAKKLINKNKEKGGNLSADESYKYLIKRLENKLSVGLGQKTEIPFDKKTHKGQVVLHYNSLAELDNILGHIQVPVFQDDE